MEFGQRRRVVASLVGVALTLSSASALAAAPREPQVKTYVVQPGDSAWSIAAEFYGSGEKYPVIYQYNNYVGKPPFLLKAGQVLKLPILGLGPEAQVSWLQKDVKAKPPRALDWLDARESMNLWRLYRVATGDESAARIVFEDDSDLKLRENALLVIYGASASASRTARNEKIEVMLEHGTIQGGLAALDKGADEKARKPMVVKTPSGQVDIYGRLAQIQADVASSMISVFDGSASVSAAGATVTVPEGQGTVVEKGKKPEAARPLPKAPSWVDGEAPALVAVVQGQKASWDAAWNPAERADTYRVELATDATFKEVLFDAEVGAGVNKLRLADLGPGRYAVRIGTRDASKLESKPGVAREVQVLSLLPARLLEAGADGVLEAVGFLKLDLPAELKASTTFSVDGGAEQPGSEPVRLMTPGLHQVRFKTGAAETTMPIRILGVKAKLDVIGAPLARLSADASADAEARGAVTIGINVEDERGRSALLPGLVLETSTGVELKLNTLGGAQSAVLMPMAADGPTRIAVRARWMGGELATQEIAVEARKGAARGPNLRDREVVAMTPHRARRSLPGTLLGPLPESRLALDTTIGDDDPGDGVLGLVLAGEVAIGDGDPSTRDAFGLNAELVVQDVRLSEASAPQSRVGDLSLGLRYALGTSPDSAVTFTPYARFSVPVGPGHETRFFGVEPGALLRFAAGDALFVDVRAAFLYNNDFATVPETSMRLGALLALTWRAAESLSLNLSGETVAGLDTSFLGHLLGFGAQLHLGDLRLGLAFGLGVGEEAKAEGGLGAFSGRLVFDIGIP